MSLFVCVTTDFDQLSVVEKDYSLDCSLCTSIGISNFQNRFNPSFAFTGSKCRAKLWKLITECKNIMLLNNQSSF